MRRAARAAQAVLLVLLVLPAAARADVTLTQDGTLLHLRATLAAPVVSDGRLCATFAWGAQTAPRSSVCVVADGALRYQRLDPFGAPYGPPEQLSRLNYASVDGTRVSAWFSPADAHLPLGPLRWQMRDGATALAAPADTTTVLVSGPRCFGAASRDPRRRCRNRALERSVTPTPYGAALLPNTPCLPQQGLADLLPCHFGVVRKPAGVALIGDSHATHWRGALDVVAQAQGFHGVSLARSGCPYTTNHIKLASAALSRSCDRHQRAVRRWLLTHPGVHTVYLSALGSAPVVGNRRAGYRAALRKLPRSVRHVYVIRDTPLSAKSVFGCVTREARRNAGVRCAQPRAWDLRPDLLARAARELRSRRYRVLDLTRYMCDRRRCFPVVGGVLVRKDSTHITATFATTLGPYLLRAVRSVAAPNG